MCRRVTCKSCGKPDWAGCGAHVDSVLGDVPKKDRCRCAEEKVTASATRSGEPGEKRSLLQRLLG